MGMIFLICKFILICVIIYYWFYLWWHIACIPVCLSVSLILLESNIRFSRNSVRRPYRWMSFHDHTASTRVGRLRVSTLTVMPWHSLRNYTSDRRNWQEFWVVKWICFHLYVVLKMKTFWDMALYSLLEAEWCFRGAYCLHHQGDNVFQQ
jgi:hypothetical protein